jgi:hypothetical protein
LNAPAPPPLKFTHRPSGTLRLLALRFLLVVLMSSPALFTGLAGVSRGAARQPYYTDPTHPWRRLPMAPLVRLLGEQLPAVLPAILLGVVLAILADQVLTGGALVLLAPERAAPASAASGEQRRAPVRVWVTIWREGLVHLWAFLRAVLLGALLAALGLALVRLAGRRIDLWAYRSAWTGAGEAFVSFVLTLTALLWLASVGAWVFWCRLITAVDARWRMRRTGLLVLRVFWRHPLRSWGQFVGLTLLSLLISGGVLFGWFQAEPSTVGGALGWFTLWLITLGIQALVWLWLVHSGRLLYARPGLADIRARRDEPLFVGRLRHWRRWFGRLLWWRHRVPPRAAEPENQPPTA